MYKVFFFSAVLACANAGLAPVSYTAAPAYAASAYVAPTYAAYGHAALAPAAITSQSQNILRSYGNLGQVSTYSKTIDTPYSSVTKSDVRVSNPGLASVSYAAPAYAHAAPLAYAAPAVARVAAPVAYAAPAVAHAAPLAYAASAYVAPTYAAYGHAALAPAAITSQSQNILRSYGNLGQVSTYSKTIDTPYSSVTKSDVRVSNPGLASVSYAAPAYAHAAPLAYAAPAVARVAAPVAYAAPAVAHAAPLAYAASAYVAPTYAAYGHAALAPAAITSQSQNILRSYGNLGQVSTYSKTIDTPYSSVTKSDVRVSNPGLASVSYAAPAYAHAAPLAYSAHGAALAAPVARVAKVFSQARAPVAHDKSDDVEVISTGTLTVPSRTPKNQLLGVVYSAAPLVSHVSFVNSRGVKYSW